MPSAWNVISQKRSDPDGWIPAFAGMTWEGAGMMEVGEGMMEVGEGMTRPRGNGWGVGGVWGLCLDRGGGLA